MSSSFVWIIFRDEGFRPDFVTVNIGLVLGLVKGWGRGTRSVDKG